MSEGNTWPKKSITVLVCGGRTYPRRERVFAELFELAGPPMGDTLLSVVHGDCPTGADRWADEWAMINWAPCRRFPPAWDDITAPGAVVRYRRDGSPYNIIAGHWRNQRMLDEGKPDLVLAFPGGPGTADMVRRARAAGVEVREVI